MSRYHFWRSTSRDTNVEASASSAGFCMGGQNAEAGHKDTMYKQSISLSKDVHVYEQSNQPVKLVFKKRC